jgi:hypothetical protein
MSEQSRDASPEQAPSQGVTRRKLFQEGPEAFHTLESSVL